MYSNFLNILIFFLNFIVKEYYDIVIIPVVIGILIKYLPFIWKLYNLIWISFSLYEKCILIDRLA